ncbi:MAG: D-alanine--D-alanine ligase, partial [Ignavibacteria bacterium]
MKVGLVLGGISDEREVSLLSGKAVLKAIKELNIDYKLIDPAFGKMQPENEEDFFKKVDNPRDSSKYIECIDSGLFDDVDVALLVLHGHFGEDGMIQALLEMKGVKYTGSGVLSSSLAMDKSMSKIMFQHFHVPTPKWFVVKHNTRDDNLIRSKIEKFFGYPCIIKPNQQGSTIG